VKKDKLQAAVEHTVAYLHQQGIPKHLSNSIKVLEKRLAEVHREQQSEADLIAATVKHWQEHMRDKKRASNPCRQRTNRTCRRCGGEH
jgi:hypothetical protein